MSCSFQTSDISLTDFNLIFCRLTGKKNSELINNDFIPQQGFVLPIITNGRSRVPCYFLSIPSLASPATLSTESSTSKMKLGDYNICTIINRLSFHFHRHLYRSVSAPTRRCLARTWVRWCESVTFPARQPTFGIGKPSTPLRPLTRLAESSGGWRSASAYRGCSYGSASWRASSHPAR